jgi:hypothetical protein
MNGVPWTPAEDESVRRLYPTAGPAAARAALPGRSLNAVHLRAHGLGCTRHPHWTPRDDARLRLLWGDGRPLPYLARKLGRSQLGVYEHAYSLGLPVGCPQGWEYLSHAADRTGYHESQLRRILKAAGKRIARALALPGKGRSRPRACIVEPQDCDDAITAWNAAEPAERAARRLGHCGEMLRRRLRLLGLAAPIRAGTRRHIRVTSDQIRAALAVRVVSGRLQPAGATP